MKIKNYYLLISLLLALSCNKTDDNKTGQNLKMSSIDLAGGGDMVISSSNEFGFDIFQRIVADEPKDINLFISPTSISLALAMTLNGARNSTADSMEHALRLPDLTNTEINAVYKSLIDGLTTVDDKVLLKIANSIWYRQDFTVEKDFLSVNQDYYASEVKGMDFSNPSAKDIINSWVEDKTNGKIKNLIDQVNSTDIMFLINAIYFKGTWQLEFDKGKTADQPFYLSDGSQKVVPMMNLKDTLNCYNNDLFQAVELDYGRGNYSMVVLLPKTGKSTGDIIKALTPENWKEWTSRFHKTEVTLSLPKFKFEYDIQLKKVLCNMGMSVAFSSNADFTGINKNGGLYIDYVRHKSFVEVNEEGTEAAAATVVGIKYVAIMENTMFVNRPFIFAIREKSTGAVAFIGRVSDPEN
jgi:serine protease inhibitor